jgi:hypothetical protein
MSALLDQEKLHDEIIEKLDLTGYQWRMVWESPLYPELINYAREGWWDAVKELWTEISQSTDK